MLSPYYKEEENLIIGVGYPFTIVKVETCWKIYIRKVKDIFSFGSEKISLFSIKELIWNSVFNENVKTLKLQKIFGYLNLK